MLARVCKMKVGKLTHVIANAHIYDRHEDIAIELLSRQSFKAPKLWINPAVDDFYKFTVDDFELLGYEYGEPIKNIPVAV